MTVHEAQLGRFYEDFEVGDVVLSWKRTVMIPRRGQGIGENYFPAAKAGPLQSRAA
jgi:hypothetical protein